MTTPRSEDDALRSIEGAAIQVTLADERVDDDGIGLEAEPWMTLARDVLHDEGVSGELDLAFLDVQAIAAHNKHHMGQDGPTDVLAFPIDGMSDDAAVVAGGAPRLLGDIVICPVVAAANAAEHRSDIHDGTIEDELALLVVHGTLHLLGWDHAEDVERVAMQTREQELLGRWWRTGERARPAATAVESS